MIDRWSLLLATTLPLLPLLGCATSSRGTSAPTELRDGLVLRYTYPDKGAVFRVSFGANDTLHFVGEVGPVAGVSAQVSYRSTPIASGITLLTWREPNGAVMTMVVDLVGLQVHAREVRDGELTALDGTVEIVSSSPP